MPETYRVTLSDGRTFNVTTAGGAPSEAEILAQLGASAAAPVATTPTSPQPKSLAGFAENVGTSGMRFGADMIAAVLSPVQTATSLLDLAAGIAQKLVPSSGKTPALNTQAAVADAMGKFLADRYGSLDAVKETAYTDPVGLMADLSVALTTGGSIVAKTGQAVRFTRLGRRLVQAGEAVRNVGDVTNPLYGPTRIAAPALEALGTGVVEATVRPPAAVKRQQTRPFEASRTIRQEHIMSAASAGKKESEAAAAASRAAEALGLDPMFRDPMLREVAAKSGGEASKRVGYVEESQQAVDDAIRRLTRDVPQVFAPDQGLEMRRAADRLANEFYRGQDKILPGQPASMEGTVQSTWGNALRADLANKSPEIAAQSDRTRRLMLSQAAMDAAEQRPHLLGKMAAMGLTGAMGPAGLPAAGGILAVDSPAIGTLLAAVLDELAKITAHPETRALLNVGRGTQAAGLTNPRR